MAKTSHGQTAARALATCMLAAALPLLGGCSAIVVAADAVVSTGVAVVGTAADLTVAGVKAVTGGSSEEDKKKN
jgi:hypothetical protein